MEREEYKQIVADMYTRGCSNKEISERTMEIYPELTYKRADARTRTVLGELSGEGLIVRRKNGKKSQDTVTIKDDLLEDKLIKMLNDGANLQEVQKELGVSGKLAKYMVNELIENGYNVQTCGEEIKIEKIVLPKENKIVEEWDGDNVIRFGLMGDTQINSKYTQLTYLHKFYDICEREGIEVIYHTGDIDDGEQMRIGHQYECYTQGADEHVKEIVRVYPRRKGITTEFITGNHDASIIKRCGYDIGFPIAEKRDDMVYLGQSNATINLTPNCTLELRHPIDGTAYALSYKLQKMVESMSGGEKPNILAVGHYHKAEYMFYRNVNCFQTGSFQSQTPFMRGKGIAAFIGGWIVEAHVNDEGTITKIKQEYIPFYEAIKDDWMNWR